MVEWKKLGEVCKVLRGKRLTKSQLNESEGYPVLHGGSTPMGYYEEFNRKANTTVVVNTGNAGCVFFYDKEFWSSDACFSLYPNKEIIDKFLYLYVYGCERILKGKIRAGAMPTIDAKAVEDLFIPIPSLSEQQRIVSILDTFTSSISNLKQQIEERRKQYEYERETLFTEFTKTKTIGELTKVFSCPRVYKDQWKDSGIPFWRSSDVMSYYNKVQNPRGKVYISESLYKDLSKKTEKIEKGDILVTGGGTIGIPYLKKDNTPLFVKDADLICIKKSESIIPSYLYHFFFSTGFQLYLKKITHDATIAHYTIGQIIDTPVPIPSLTEQSRIVSILDTFEQSIANLEEQLAMREKQYEYYREKLLRFEEA